MVWIKQRNAVGSNAVFDTERGVGNTIITNATGGNQTYNPSTQDFKSFNADGFSLNGTEWTANVNNSGTTFASWTFRKQAGFFDVVTYTGDGIGGRTVSHNLGSVPACIIVKRTNNTGSWIVYHSGLNGGSNPEHYSLSLELNSAEVFDWSFYNTAPTSTEFTVGSTGNVNGSGDTYVAYLFAHDDQSFGDDSDESIIKCGSYTGDGTSGHLIDVGFEPQWVLIKRTDSSTPWYLADNMRNMSNKGATNLSSNYLFPNEGWSEDYIRTNYQGTHHIEAKPTGFAINPTENDLNRNGNNYIYIAIRRPMKTPESGTEVFSISSTMSGTSQPAFDAGHLVDMAFQRRPAFTQTTHIASRLIGTNNLYTDTTAAEVSQAENVWDFMQGWGGWTVDNSDYRAWNFKRATGCFDVVAYSGDGTAHAETHNLGVVPELLIVKNRSGVRNWFVWVNGFGSTDYLELNLTSQKQTGANIWNSTVPTDTQFSVGGVNNTSGNNFIAYLFATLAGISKVGSYTGTGSDLNVDCGFTSGARFILIKRTDSTGDWYVYDSARGIVAGNDPYLLLNSTAVEVTSTDYIDPLSSGFTVTSSAPAGLNASGGSYIFLAIS